MNFDVAGPFKLTRHGTKKLITDQSLTELKAELEGRDSGLSKACGCYVFAIHTPKGYTPYYVGQASKQSIVGEALNPSNREKYNKACSESKGSPTIFLLPKLTPKGRYKKKGRVSATIDFLEGWLIAAALQKNRELINTKETRFLREISVAGIFNPKKGKPQKASRELKKALW
jgi:hypothetical protein